MAIVTDKSVGGILAKIDNTKTPTDGQFLSFNSTSGKWEPATPSSGGVTRIFAGTGINVSSSTGAVTISSTVPSTAGSTASVFSQWVPSNSSGQVSVPSGSWSGFQSQHVGSFGTISGGSIMINPGAVGTGLFYVRQS